MAQDILNFEILDDGSIKVTTDKISAANHLSADEFMSFLAKQMGGATKKQKRSSVHAHAHTHVHQRR